MVRPGHWRRLSNQRALKNLAVVKRIGAGKAYVAGRSAAVRAEAARDSAAAAHVAGRDFVSHRTSKSLSILKIAALRHAVANGLIEKTQLFPMSK
jgi:hypothetical protein